MICGMYFQGDSYDVVGMDLEKPGKHGFFNRSQARAALRWSIVLPDPDGQLEPVTVLSVDANQIQ